MKFFKTIRELRSFLLLWGSQAVSSLGTAMTEYALVVWVYGQNESASDVTLLTLCIFAPTILFRFLAGAIADKWDKKRIMLLADLFAACGTLSILLLHSFSALKIWHIYFIDVLLSFMNAFQQPASFVATSLLVPKEHYTKAGGLQGFSRAAVSVLAPALGAAVLAFGGLEAVLIVDLATFFIAFAVLLFFIKLPKIEKTEKTKNEPFLRTCTEGIRYLRGHKVMLRLILFFTCVNFLAKIGSDGMIAPFVLGRTGNDQQILGAVQSSVAFGLLSGSLIVTWMKAPENKVRFICLTTAVVFAGDLFLSFSASPAVWCIASFVSYAFAAVMNTNLTVFTREQVPVDMQGRVFSAQDTLQNCSIPLGLFLGGFLADHVFEPFMAGSSALQKVLALVFGGGKGSGIAVIYFIAGVLGIIMSLVEAVKVKKE